MRPLAPIAMRRAATVSQGKLNALSPECELNALSPEFPEFRIFKSYDQIVDQCCDAWNKLIDQPWKIISIGLRKWAHGF